MTKPIVVLMPGRERAVLREGGALPVSFFGAENAVRLWPHDIDHLAGLKIAENIANRPGDVPVFFGFPPSENTSEINERTAEIVSILESTMVHVVFLDDVGDIGKIEYGHFGSFKSIIDWSRSLIKVLRTRFVGEVNLHRLDNVLVVVCRQQIRVTEEECREFMGLIGENPNDAKIEELKPFTSCYFLNHELSIDDAGMDIYAREVWDIVVGRLLKAFVLSREQHASGSNSERTIWMRPGMRVWKTEECHMVGAETAIRRATEKVLAQIRDEARDAVVEAEGGGVLSDPNEGYPSSAVQPEIGLDYQGHWSRFDASALAKGVEHSRMRSEQVAESAASYSVWRRNNERPDNMEMNRVFLAIKDDPRQLFACSREVDQALSESCPSATEMKDFKTLVTQMAQTEERRRGLIDGLSTMAEQLKLAQRHYVGWGVGLFVAAAVIAMLGVAFWQVVTLLGGSLGTVCEFVTAGAVGSLATVVAVVAVHYHNGYSAAEAYVATCRELDATSVQRLNEARRILCEAVKARLDHRRRNSRLKMHDLLARVRDTLVRELQYKPAVAAQQIARRERNMSEFTRGQRRLYLENTRNDIQVAAALVRTSDVEEDLLALWKGGEGSFCNEWKRFCQQFDERNCGHLPVSVLIPRVRDFMERFVRRARWLVRLSIDDSCHEEKRKSVKAWLGNSDKVLLYSGKAAVNVRVKPLKRHVFVAKDMHPGFMNAVHAATDQEGNTEVSESVYMTQSDDPLVAYAIHEVPILLHSEELTGVLALQQADWEDEK